MPGERATIFRGGHVLSMDDGIGVIEGGDVLIRGREIVAVGRNLPAEGAETIDCAGRVVMPGFIDGHRHCFSGLVRGGGIDAAYGSYFDIIVKGFGCRYTPEDTHLSVRLGALESIESGITTLHAWEHNLISLAHAEASARALHETGLRGRFSFGPPNDTMVVRNDDLIALRGERFTGSLNGVAATPDERWQLGLSTRGVERDEDEVWQREIAFARDQGIPITAHVHKGQIPKLHERGALGPDFLAVHVNDATVADIELLRRTDTPVCVAPIALARTGLGWSPIIDLMQGGVPICLSIDSLAGSDSSDYFVLMRFSLFSMRMLHRDITIYSPTHVLHQATLGGAKALGIDRITGSLTPGKRADLIVLDPRTLNMTPTTVLTSQIVLCAQPRNVEHVYIDGVARKRDGCLVGVDLAEEMAAANAALRQLERRAGQSIV